VHILVMTRAPVHGKGGWPTPVAARRGARNQEQGNVADRCAIGVRLSQEPGAGPRAGKSGPQQRRAAGLPCNEILMKKMSALADAGRIRAETRRPSGCCKRVAECAHLYSRW
jgi:hypothetical protein